MCESALLKYGMYWLALDAWVRRFPGSKFIVTTLSDYSRDCRPVLRKIATALSVKAVLPDAIKVSGVANQAQNKIGDGDDDVLEAHTLLDRFYKEHSKFFWKQLTTLTADAGPYDVTFVGTIGEY